MSTGNGSAAAVGCAMTRSGPRGETSLPSVRSQIITSEMDTVESMEVAKPVPADNQVLVKVQAASVNALEARRFESQLSGGNIPIMIRVMDGVLLKTPMYPPIRRVPENVQLTSDELELTRRPGGRYEIDFDRWMRMDLQYIDNWSPSLDLKILLRTIPAVLLGRGAS